MLVDLLLGWYLSDDQRAVFTGRGARVALAFIVNNHGFDRLGLSVTQPGGSAGEQATYSPHTRPAHLFHPADSLGTTGVVSRLNQTNVHSPGVLGARGRLFTRFLINLFVVVFVSGV